MKRLGSALLMLGLLGASLGCRKDPAAAKGGTSSWPAQVMGLAPDLYELHRASAAGRAQKFAAIVALGPAAAGAATAAERERTLRDLLAGRAQASALPLAAVDRGQAFEPALRHVIAPGSLGDLAQVFVENVMTTGGLESAAAELAIRRRSRWYEACVLPWLMGLPGRRGSVRVRWTVGSQGNVTGVWKTEAHSLPERVTACVVRHSHSLTFPGGHSAGATVTAELKLGMRVPTGNPNAPRRAFD